MSDSTREALHEIGERARGIVEELARHARTRRDEAAATTAAYAAAAAGPAGEAAPPALHHRLNELRACVGEVADVLEATVERLETVELQLGDPDASIERQLAEGILRCERVLMGIEHRVVLAVEEGVPEAPRRTQRRGDVPTVLVVAHSSRRRAHLCLALERQGLRALAAADLALAVGMAVRRRPSVALVELGDWHGIGAEFLEEWKEHEEHGILPCAAVLEAGDASGASALGFETINEEHGEAAMAACLTRMARDGRDDAAVDG